MDISYRFGSSPSFDDKGHWPWAPQLLFADLSISLQSLVIIQEPWIARVSHFASSGILQAVILSTSVLWILVRLLQRRNAATLGFCSSKTSSIKWTYELSSQAARASSVAFSIMAVAKGRIHYLNLVAIAYAFVLGLLRLAGNVPWRQTALHQINWVLTAMLFLLAAAHFLPCIEIAAQCPEDLATAGAVASVAAAVIVAAITPRVRLPSNRDFETPGYAMDREAAPEETCSWFNYYCTYDWLTPLIWKGATRRLDMSAIPSLAWYDEPMYLLRRLRRARSVSANTLWTTLRFQRVELSLMALWAGLSFSTENIAPYGMFRLLDFLSRPEGASFHPWIWVVLTFIGPMCRTVLFQQYVFTSTRLIVRIKSAMTQELYHRALTSMELEDDPFNLGTDSDRADEKNPQAGPRSTSSGRLANLMAADIDAIFRARDVIMCFVGVPIGTILSLVGLYRMMGWASLVGITVILLATPLSASLGRAMFRAQRRVRKAQDGRISLVTEYLASIRAIKYFAWEDAVSDKVAQARILEQSGMWHVSVLQTIITQITQVFPYVGMLVMFGLHVGVGQHQLDASTAFTAIFLVKNIRRNIMMASNFSRNFASAAVAIDRLDRYFESTVPLTRYPAGPLRIEDASFRRNKKAVFRLEDISLDFVQGGLNVITGQSGSGKSTLLLAILGEAHLEGGRVTAPDDIAYASQSAWLQNDTIQANILFQSPMEEARYDRVIQACCLAVDLKELPDGDRTVVGENGTSLSGGQKSRVALARALYSKSPLLLLDDIFSALDAKTSAGVWKYCFCSDLLRRRTVVLVTQVPWISSQADLTVVLDKGRVQDIEQNIGAVRTPITIAEVLGGDDEGVDTESSAGSGPNFPRNISCSSPSASASPSSSPPPDSITRVAHEPSANDIVNQEMKASGAIGRLASLQYMGYFGHPVFIAACLLGLILSNFLSYGSSYWMSVWVEAYNKYAHVDIAYYLGIYAALSLAETALYGVVMIGFEWGAWRASRKLHNDFLRAVMRVSLSWFKTVPVGRVTNRFSGDMASIDMVLCSFLRATLDAVIMILFRVAAVSTIMPVFMLPALLMCVLGVVVGEMYTRTAVVIKRLTSSAQSPVFSQFADTLAGLSVIRARRGMDETFGQQLAAKLRVWSATSEANYNCNRWVAVRVDFGTALVALSASIIALHKVGLVGAGLVGFSLQNANGLSQTILMLVRAMNDLEVEMQSFHRVKEYVKLEQEEAGDQPYPAEGEYADEATCTIPKNWPASGEIEFRNVTIRYDEDGPDILTDVNLRFKAGERVAVVGRTGSGKSTLVLSLLRFTHIVEGQIFLNGIDISRIPRHRLRESLSIIPQEATLFNGTVRSNLDPAGVVAEETLEGALDNCRGIASFSGDEDGGESCGLVGDDRHSQKISLATAVDARGDNFSHGQRQVLSLCRALIRQSKVMLLDEATASMDYETDRGMQEVLRRELEDAGGGRTLVTIAHRLRTIIDYDSVVVMSAGKVVEYGSPRDLYHARGQFYDMMYHSGELEELREMLGEET